MKILFWQCDNTDWDACKWIYREAKEQGYDVEIAGSRSDPRELIKKLDTFKPDWVLSLAVRPHLNSTYAIIKSKGIKLAMIYNDGIDDQRMAMFEKMRGCFDIAIFSTIDAMDKVGFCAEKSYFLPEYFDTHFHELKWKRLDQTKPIYDLCFMSFVPCVQRNALLKKLSSKYSIYQPKNKFGADMTEAYSQCKIALGLPRKGFGGNFFTSNRLYWAMGSGCFYLTHYIENIQHHFQVGVDLEMTFDNSYEEYDDIIQYFLENETEREKIAYTGQQEILKNHTLKTRVPQYLRLLENFKE